MARRACRGHHGMWGGRSPDSERGPEVRALVMAALVVVGLFVAGSIVVWAVKAVIGMLIPVLVIALVGGGILYIVSKVRKPVGGRNRGQIRP